MSDPFTVPACRACGHALWPPRPVCPRCGGTEFAPLPASGGVVEETTLAGETALASVRSSAGPVVIARLAAQAAAGAAVELRWARAPDGAARLLATPARPTGRPRRS